MVFGGGFLDVCSFFEAVVVGFSAEVGGDLEQFEEKPRGRNRDNVAAGFIFWRDFEDQKVPTVGSSRNGGLKKAKKVLQLPITSGEIDGGEPDCQRVLAGVSAADELAPIVVVTIAK